MHIQVDENQAIFCQVISIQPHLNSAVREVNSFLFLAYVPERECCCTDNSDCCHCRDVCHVRHVEDSACEDRVTLQAHAASLSGPWQHRLSHQGIGTDRWLDQSTLAKCDCEGSARETQHRRGNHVDCLSAGQCWSYHIVSCASHTCANC